MKEIANTWWQSSKLLSKEEAKNKWTEAESDAGIQTAEVL